MGGTVAGETESIADSDVAYAPGMRIGGRYHVVRFIAAGGMGEVYEANDLVLGETVALKTLRIGLAASERSVERLRRELAFARKITHPNVCRMHDVGEHDGRVFLTMELVRGDTLASTLADGPLARERLVDIANQLVAALAAAHAAGVVHRDFKTANVLVATTGRAVVTDFGLARAAAAEEQYDSLTGEAALIGTPAYMAPEQVEGQPATPASDIYALGVVLYELATGSVPFREATALGTATARLLRPARRPSTLRRDLDPAIEAAIMRCLEREPTRRFPRVEDVATALRDSRRRRRGWLAAAVVLVLGTAATALATTRAPAPTENRVAPVREWPAALRPARVKAAVHLDDAHAAIARDDWDAARELAEQAVAADPTDPIAQALLAKLLLSLGYVERAGDASWRALANRHRLGPEPRAYVELVDALVRGARTTAIERYQLLIVLAPHERLYPLGLAEALARDKPQHAAALLAGLGRARNHAEQIARELVASTIAEAAGDTASRLAHARAATALALLSARRRDHARALLATAAAEWARNDGSAAERSFSHALALSAIAHHTGDEHRARHGLIDLDLAADQIRRATDRHVENIALLRRLGDRKHLIDELEDAARLQLAIGRTRDAAAAIDAQHQLAHELGDEPALGYADATSAFLALQRGKLADAARHGEAAFMRGRQLGIAGMQGNAFHSWLEAVVELDDDAEVARARTLRGRGVERLIDSYAALRVGELDRAVRIASSLANSRTREGREAQVVLAHALVKQGSLDRASELLAAAAPGLVGDGSSLLARRRLVRAQAELAAARGDVAGALAQLDTAAAECGEVDLRFCQVPTAALAAELATRHASPDARARVATVLALATEHGFKRTERELRALAQRNASALRP